MENLKTLPNDELIDELKAFIVGVSIVWAHSYSCASTS
jgi:hypothetical protein